MKVAHEKRVAALIIIVLAFATTHFLIGAAQAQSSGGIQADFLSLLNAERSSLGKTPLTSNSQLESAAYLHSKDMGDNDYFDHTSLDGTTFSERITAAGYQWRSASENIAMAYGAPNAAKVYDMWRNSPGHYANMIGDYADAGLGVYSIGGYTYYTLDLGRSQSSPTQTPRPTVSPIPTPHPTATPSPTPNPTASPTPLPTAIPTPIPTAPPTSKPTPTPTATPTPTQPPTASPTPRSTTTITPTATPTPTPKPTATPTSTPPPTPKPSTQQTTATPTPNPTATATTVQTDPTTQTSITPSPEPTSITSSTPTPTPSIPELPLYIVPVMLLVLSLAAATVLKNKTKKK